MEDKFLEKIEFSLEKEKEEIKKELDRISEKVSGEGYRASFPEYGDKEDENAAEITSYEEHLAIRGNLEKRLSDIKEAILRIEEKKYGICEKCNKKIETGRLEANPAATLCVECKSLEEISK